MLRITRQFTRASQAPGTRPSWSCPPLPPLPWWGNNLLLRPSMGPPPIRDSIPSPRPEVTGTLSTLRVDLGGVAKNQSPPSCGLSTTAQESSLCLPLAHPGPPLTAGLGLPTVHRLPRRPISRPSPDQHPPPSGAGTPPGSGEPWSLPGRPELSLLGLDRFLHVSPDPPRSLGRRASTGVTWSKSCWVPSLRVTDWGSSSFSQLGLASSFIAGSRS